MLDLPKLNHRECWTGTHRGINFELSRHASGPIQPDGYTWCYYLFLQEKQCPPALIPKFFLPLAPVDSKWPRKHWDYYADDCAWRDLEWHGGITYYSMEDDTAGSRVCKAGCDFCHSFDRDQVYSRDTVLHECLNTIKCLHDTYPGLLARCSYNGEYHEPSNLLPWGDGFICPACKILNDKQKELRV